MDPVARTPSELRLSPPPLSFNPCSAPSTPHDQPCPWERAGARRGAPRSASQALAPCSPSSLWRRHHAQRRYWNHRIHAVMVGSYTCPPLTFTRYLSLSPLHPVSRTLVGGHCRCHICLQRMSPEAVNCSRFVCATPLHCLYCISCMIHTLTLMYIRVLSNVCLICAPMFVVRSRHLCPSWRS